MQHYSPTLCDVDHICVILRTYYVCVQPPTLLTFISLPLVRLNRVPVFRSKLRLLSDRVLGRKMPRISGGARNRGQSDCEGVAVARPMRKQKGEAREIHKNSLHHTAIGLLSLLSPVPGRAQNIINTVAGGGKVGGPALAADIAGPSGVVKDSKGNSYITGAGLYVFKVNPASDLSVYAGTGFGGIQGVGGPATSATLQGPAALALDSRDNLFIADSLSNHIWTVDASTGILTNVAGNATADNPLGGFGGDGGKATRAQLNTPQGVAVAANGTVYIADQANNRIRRVKNGIITTFAGDGTVCADPTTPCGDGGKATNAHLNTPLGVAVDGSGNVFIADAGDQRIRRVDHTSNIITTVAGNGAGCVDPTQLAVMAASLRWPN